MRRPRLSVNYLTTYRRNGVVIVVYVELTTSVVTFGWNRPYRTTYTSGERLRGAHGHGDTVSEGKYKNYRDHTAVRD